MDYEKVRELTFEELLETISEEDKALLYSFIEEDPKARNIWESIRAESPRLLADAKESHEHNPAEEVLAHLNKRNRMLYVKRASSIAAAVLLAIAGCWYLLENKHQKPIASSGGKDNHVRLVTASGKTIDLTVDTAAIRLGQTTLTNTQKTLSFEADGHNTGEINTLTVPAGQDYNLLLADGTQIQLNSATTVSFPFNFTGNNREVTVNGEAYFRIAGNAEKPFLVHLPGTTIKVLGTAFNINTYDTGSIKVALVEGAVKVESGKQKMTLKPGYEITRNENGMQAAPFDPDQVLSWRTGVYIFEDRSLEELAPTILRWYSVKIALDNERIRTRRFFGVIDRHLPLQAFQQNLDAADDVKSYYDKEGVLHFK